MPNFIQHSFSATENSPVLQFALDNLAGGKSLLIGLKSSNFQDLFCSLGFGIAANVLSNGANLGILSDDESLKKAFEGLISQQNWAELFINFQPEKIAEYLNQISQRKRSHSLKFPLPSRSVRVLQLCAAQIQAHRQTLQKWAEFRHNGLSYSELVVKNLQKKEENSLTYPLKNFNHQFNGNSHEWENLLAKIQEAENLYTALGSFQHPLNVLNDRFFRQNDAQLAQATAAETLDKVAFVVDAANRDAFSYLFKYEKWIEDHYTEIFANQNAQIEKLQKLCESGAKLGKFVHNTEKSFGERVGGFFKSLTGQNKALEIAQNELKTAYLELQKYQQKYNYVPHKFLNLAQENLTFAQVAENIGLYSQHILDWYKQKELLVRAASKRLSRHEIHSHSSYLGFVHQFLSDLDLFAERLNLANLLKVKFVFQSENVSERIRELESLQKNIANLRENWEKFDEYFNLKYFWLGLNEGEKKLIIALSQLGISHWAQSFAADLSNKILAEAEADFIPQRASYDKKMDELTRNLAEAKTELNKFVLPHWRGIWGDFNPQKLTSVENKTEFLHFSNYFPLVCTNSEVLQTFCENLTPEKDKSNIFFNLLIIDGRGKDKLFSQQISPKAQLIVWITDELESLDLNPNIAVWPQQSLAFNYFDNTAPFYLWLQKQIQAQNADIQADTNSELNNFEGKIPLLLTFGTKKIAVFADFFSYTDTENSYLWEIYTQNQLQKTDVLFYKTYTSAWRENAAAELKKLLAVCD